MTVPDEEPIAEAAGAGGYMAYLHAKSCGDKVAFGTRRAARQEVRRHYLGQGFHAYLCDFCGQFHVGHRHTEALRRRPR